MKISILAVLLLAMIGSQAQELEIKISPFKFNGVFAVKDNQQQTNAFISVYSKSNGIWEMQIIAQDLSESKTFTLDVPKNALFHTMVSSGDQNLICFVDNSFKPALHYLLIDREGNIKQSLSKTKVPLLARGKAYWPQLYALEQGNFIVVEPAKSKSTGYSLECFDKQLKSLWRKEFYAEKGNARVYEIWITEQGILTHQLVEKFGNVLNSSMVYSDNSTGNTIFNTSLSNGENSFYPTAFYPEKDKSVVMAGTFYKGSKIESKNSKGLFLAEIDSDGIFAAKQLMEWKSLKPILKTRVSDWFFKVMPEVWLHRLDKTEDGSYVALGELFKYAGEITQTNPKTGETEAPFHKIRLMDFMRFNFSSTGEMTAAERIEKPHQFLHITADMTAETGSIQNMITSGNLNRNKALKESNGFSFRDAIPLAEGQYTIVFASYENFVHYTYLLNTNYGNYHKYAMLKAKAEIISQLEIASRIANQYDDLSLEIEGSTLDFDGSEQYFRGVLPAVENEFLLYEYVPLKSLLSLKLITDQ